MFVFGDVKICWRLTKMPKCKDRITCRRPNRNVLIRETVFTLQQWPHKKWRWHLLKLDLSRMPELTSQSPKTFAFYLGARGTKAKGQSKTVMQLYSMSKEKAGGNSARKTPRFRWFIAQESTQPFYSIWGELKINRTLRKKKVMTHFK